MRAITATFLAWVMVVSAQQAPAPQQQPAPDIPKGTVKFEVTRQLVVEDIIIKDKSGNPITGLKPSDFVVLEDGKPQKVEFVEFQNLEEEPLPPPALQQRGPDVEVSKAAPKAVTTNQIAPEKPGDIKYKDKRLMVMFFDMTSMPIADQIRAQTAAEKFINTQMT